MRHDASGLVLTTDSDAAAAAFDVAVAGYLGYRAGQGKLVAAVQRADPGFALGHVFAGYVAMLAFSTAMLPAAGQARDAAEAVAAGATPRERAHLAALRAWVGGDMEEAVRRWEAIVAEHPLDVLAFRLAHFSNFWLGRPRAMAASAARVLPHFAPDMPGYPAVLACLSFALEECGRLTEAEPPGRESIARDPGNLWGAHAVAHVLEMQGRRGEGIALLTALAPNWAGANNLMHHLWWHCALFHLERGEHDAVLTLYDTRFRDLSAPLVQAAPDLYIDVQNAVSMLFRLQRLGVDAGTRWQELADHAEARIGDCLSAFTLPHWAMALASTGRSAALARLLDGIAAAAEGQGVHASLLREVALPVCAAVRARAAGDDAAALALLRPVLGDFPRLGGSHAQQDFLEQIFLDVALRAERDGDVRTALERFAGRRAVPPARWAGWREAAALARF